MNSLLDSRTDKVKTSKKSPISLCYWKRNEQVTRKVLMKDAYIYHFDKRQNNQIFKEMILETFI
jgi:hypothetical protein